MTIDSKLDALKAQREAFEAEFKARLEALQAEEAKLSKIAEKKTKIIETVQKFGIDPVLLFEILHDAELIEVPVDTSRVRAGGTVEAKYQHPSNKDLTWTGRGKRPKWMTEYLNGDENKLAELLISNQVQEATTE